MLLKSAIGYLIGFSLGGPIGGLIGAIAGSRVGANQTKSKTIKKNKHPEQSKKLSNIPHKFKNKLLFLLPYLLA